MAGLIRQITGSKFYHELRTNPPSPITIRHLSLQYVPSYEGTGAPVPKSLLVTLSLEKVQYPDLDALADLLFNDPESQASTACSVPGS